MLYHAVSQQQHNTLSQQQLNTQDLHTQKHRRLHEDLSKLSNTATASPNAHSSAANQAKTGDASLTTAQKAVRVAFYLWLGLLNLLATSTLWTRAADAFDSNAASRLFGFLGAGATIGASPFQKCCDDNQSEGQQSSARVCKDSVDISASGVELITLCSANVSCVGHKRQLAKCCDSMADAHASLQCQTSNSAMFVTAE